MSSVGCFCFSLRHERRIRVPKSCLPPAISISFRNTQWHIDDRSTDERKAGRGGERPPSENRGAGRRRIVLHADSRRYDRRDVFAADGGEFRCAAGFDEHRHHGLHADDGGFHPAFRLARRSFRRAPGLPGIDCGLHRCFALLRSIRQPCGIHRRACDPGRRSRVDDAGRAHHRLEKCAEIRAGECDRADHLASADGAGHRTGARRFHHHLCKLALELSDQYTDRAARHGPGAAFRAGATRGEYGPPRCPGLHPERRRHDIRAGRARTLRKVGGQPASRLCDACGGHRAFRHGRPAFPRR